jgi:hypothetical protein
MIKGQRRMVDAKSAPPPRLLPRGGRPRADPCDRMTVPSGSARPIGIVCDRKGLPATICLDAPQATQAQPDPVSGSEPRPRADKPLMVENSGGPSIWSATGRAGSVGVPVEMGVGVLVGGPLLQRVDDAGGDGAQFDVAVL